MKSIVRYTLLVLLLTTSVLPAVVYSGEQYVDGEHYYLPEEGFVPDEETAIKIAEAVWLPIYGREQIDSERPIKAQLEGDIWYVTGSLPEEWLGGVAEAEIQKLDGKVLRVSHGQ